MFFKYLVRMLGETEKGEIWRHLLDQGTISPQTDEQIQPPLLQQWCHPLEATDSRVPQEARDGVTNEGPTSIIIIISIGFLGTTGVTID